MRASMLEQWSRKLERHRNRLFLEAAMAAAALVATADDEVRLSEQLALDVLLERLDRLSIFDPHTGVELHRRHVEAIETDRVKGRKAALDVLTNFPGDEEQRLLILYVGTVIARADEEFADSERFALVAICDALGLPMEPSLTRIWSSGSADAPAP